ncbi:MAG: M28 family metallopeptidase [Micromonosporaceae bacterium]
MRHRTPETYPVPDRDAPGPVRVQAADTAPRKWTGSLPDKYLATVVELVSQANLEATVNHLASYHTRHSLSAGIGQVADSITAQFQGYGYAGVSSHTYTRNGHTLRNVVCRKPGNGAQPKTVLLCGHYDSRAADLSDATTKAPGADDNATGIALILECARLLRHAELADTLLFVAFSGEEQGLWGSAAYAEALQQAGEPIELVYNVDMVGYPPPGGAIIVERDMGNAVASNDAASVAAGAVVAQLATDYTTLPPQLGPIYASDYMPFEARSYVAVGLFEAGTNPGYHNVNDTVDKVDFGYLTEVTKLALASMVQFTAGFVDEAASGVDLYIRDSAIDTGAQPSGVPHWISPDLWVRLNPPGPGEDPDAGHQNPVLNQPNHLYVRVRNRGTAASAAVTVATYHCDPATAMLWPTHFTSMGTLTVPGGVPAGGAVRAGPFVWTPTHSDHECLLAVASAGGDHAVPDFFGGVLRHDLLVRYDNNVGQRNVSPVYAVPGGKLKTSFLVRGAELPSSNELSIDATALPPDTGIVVQLPRRLTDSASDATGMTVAAQTSRLTRYELAGGDVGRLRGFALPPLDEALVGLRVDFSLDAQHLQTYPIIATQIQDGSIAGRLSIELTAVKETDDFVYGNPRSYELHTVHCPLWSRIAVPHRVPYPSIEDALARGYNGCAYCLPEHHTS